MFIKSFKCLWDLWPKRAHYNTEDSEMSTPRNFVPRDPHICYETPRRDYKHILTFGYENTYISLWSRRDRCIIRLAISSRTCYTIQVFNQSRRVMYDDYDLDYSFSNDYNLDEDSYYEHYAQGDANLDEDYARDGQDYESLAYRHYAWYNLVHTSRRELCTLHRSA